MKKNKVFACAMLSGVLLIPMMIGTAMLTYSIPYLWEKMFLSALGLTKLSDGTSNFFASMMFNVALLFGGILSSAYFVFRAKCATSKIVHILLWIAGIAGGLALAGIGLLPYNLFPNLHNGCTWIASGGFALGIFANAAAVRGSGTTHSENILLILFGMFAMLIWLALQYLRTHGMLPSVPTGPIQQKIIILYFWLYMFWNSLQLYCMTRRKQ